MTASKQAEAREPTLLSPPLGAAERAAVLAEVAEVAAPPLGVAAEAAVPAGAPPLVLAAALLLLALRAPLGVAEVRPLGVLAEALLLRAPSPLPRRRVGPSSLGRMLLPGVPRVALQVPTPPQVVHPVVARGSEGASGTHTSMGDTWPGTGYGRTRANGDLASSPLRHETDRKPSRVPQAGASSGSKVCAPIWP